jgi:hypothetical protein
MFFQSFNIPVPARTGLTNMRSLTRLYPKFAAALHLGYQMLTVLLGPSGVSMRLRGSIKFLFMDELNAIRSFVCMEKSPMQGT